MTDQPWYFSWFNSKFYHILYNKRDDDEAQIFLNKLLEYLKPPKECKFLDLACGRGRHSIYLNNMGYYVHGVDISTQSIAHAKQFEKDDLKFSVHDIRKPFIEKGFNYVLNLFTSMGYFENKEENLEVIKSSGSNLEQGGMFVIDYLNAHKVVKNLVKNEEIKAGGITFHISRSVENSTILKTIEFTHENQEYCFQERVQGFLKEDFIRMLEEAAFRIINTFGNYNLDSFDLEKSDRLILIAKIK